MKNYKTLFVAITLCLAGCSKKPVVLPITLHPAPLPGFAADTSAKRGSAFSTNSTNSTNGIWSSNIVNLKSNWFYTWGTTMPSQTGIGNIEFVPMFWGSGNVNLDNIAAVKQMKSNGTAHYILGFNEPDMPGQANMTVQAALTLWPQLESIGLPLGSPATSWPTRQWMYDFMDAAIAQHRRVDFICVHMYVGLDDASFIQVLKDLYSKYHLPIWITEFATADFSATTTSNNRYTPAQVLAFMQRLLPKLEALPYVKRYSWFSGSVTWADLWSSALIDGSGQLTANGTWYSTYKP